MYLQFDVVLVEVIQQVSGHALLSDGQAVTLLPTRSHAVRAQTSSQLGYGLYLNSRPYGLRVLHKEGTSMFTTQCYIFYYSLSVIIYLLSMTDFYRVLCHFFYRALRDFLCR